MKKINLEATNVVVLIAHKIEFVEDIKGFSDCAHTA